jgi:hypothetical protein
MTPDQPPKLIPYTDFDCQYENVPVERMQELRENKLNWTVHVDYHNAIEREDYMLEKLELALQNHNWWIIRALLLLMRKSR